MERNEIIVNGRESKYVDRIVEILNAGSTTEGLGFRLITRSQDVILRIERDNTKKNPIQYLVVSLSKEFYSLFSGVVQVSFNGNDSLEVLAFNQANVGDKFHKVGNRYNLKISTSGLPAIGDSVKIIYEMKSGHCRNHDVEVKRPKDRK